MVHNYTHAIVSRVPEVFGQLKTVSIFCFSLNLSDGSGSKFYNTGFIGSFFCCSGPGWIGSAISGSGKFPPKNHKFFLGQKISQGMVEKYPGKKAG